MSLIGAFSQLGITLAIAQAHLEKQMSDEKKDTSKVVTTGAEILKQEHDRRFVDEVAERYAENLPPHIQKGLDLIREANALMAHPLPHAPSTAQAQTVARKTDYDDADHPAYHDALAFVEDVDYVSDANRRIAGKSFLAGYDHAKSQAPTAEKHRGWVECPAKVTIGQEAPAATQPSFDAEMGVLILDSLIEFLEGKADQSDVGQYTNEIYEWRDALKARPATSGGKND